MSPVRFSLPDGTRIPTLTLIPFMDKRAIATCPKCGGTWPVFAAEASPDLAAIQVLGITETHRSEEPIGTDERRVDIASSAVRVTRTVRVTKEWNRTVSLNLNDTFSATSGIQIGPLQTSIERTLERIYEISINSREQFDEEVGVEIEPATDATMTFTWKRIWQHGVAHVLAQGHQADVPFRMAVGVTFDQSIR